MLDWRQKLVVLQECAAAMSLNGQPGPGEAGGASSN